MDSLIQDTLTYIEQNYNVSGPKVAPSPKAVTPPPPPPVTPPPPKAKAPTWIEKKSSAPIAFVYHTESAEEFALLERFKDAIGSKVAPAVLVSGTTLERQGGWGQFLESRELRIVCVTQSSLATLPSLRGNMAKVLIVPPMRQLIETPPLRKAVFEEVIKAYAQV